jgi:putative PIN family toxin of toxin-antitoxin system
MKYWVVDTNVVVSGLLSPRGHRAQILDAILEGRVGLVYDPRILAEYRDVLCRKRLKLNPIHVISFIEGLRAQMLVLPVRIEDAWPDPDDLMFVEAALAVPDRTIVTGNLAHFPSKILRGVTAMTPAQAATEASRGLAS